MSYKILANDGISEEGKTALEAAGNTVITNNVQQEQLIEYINKNNVDILLVRSATKVRKDIIDACNLKAIGRGGVGMDNIDVAYARSKGITVFNTPASSSQSVAEMVFAHLFGMVRLLHDSNRQMPVNGIAKFKDLKKKYGKGTELRGKKLGIIGMGRIGKSTASYALGIGMEVIGNDMFGDSFEIKMNIGGQEFAVNLPNVPMEELIEKADIISVHVPKQESGAAVIGESEIAKMKDGVYLINLSRGGVIDEDALLDALNNGKVAAAALDVFENEPTPREDLLTHPALSLSPHIGAATAEAQDRIGLEIAEIIADLK